MPKIEVWECPRTKKVFKTLSNYKKHLKNLARITYIDPMIPRLKAEALREMALIRDAYDADDLAARLLEHQSAIFRFNMLISNHPERHSQFKDYKPITDIKVELPLLDGWEVKPIHFVNEKYEALTGIIHIKHQDNDRLWYLPNIFTTARDPAGFTTGYFDRHTPSMAGYKSYEFHLIRSAGWPNIEHAILAAYLAQEQ